MSDDLIERLRARANFFDSIREFDAPSGALEREAADAIAAKDTALSEMRAELDEFDETNRQLVKSYDFWRDKARTAEAELERVKKALAPFAREAEAWAGYDDVEPLTEGWGGGPATQLIVEHLRAARALAPSIQDETDLGARG